MRELRFKSETNGSIEYVAWSEVSRTYSRCYFANNGGHRPCPAARRRDVREKAAELAGRGFVCVDRVTDREGR